MMETKKGKQCRNLPEQVQKNMEDIEKLKGRYPTTNYVINAVIDTDDPHLLHVTKLVEGEAINFDFRGGETLLEGPNITITPTEEGLVISATTEPVGSVSFENVVGSPFDNTLLGNELNNRMKLTQSGAWGQETNGWLRIRNQSGIQLYNTVNNKMLWFGDAKLRYYADRTATQVYTDLFFGDHSGTIAVVSDIPTKVSELENDSEYITGSALEPYATKDWTEDYVPRYVRAYHDEQKQDVSSLFFDVQNLGFALTSQLPDKYVRLQQASGNTLTWVFNDGTTQSWTPESGEGGITDVRVNGSSVVTEGIANINIPADAQLVYDMTLDPTTGAVTINSDNYYNRIVQYIEDNDKYPVIYGVVHIPTQPDMVVLIKEITLSSESLLLKGYVSSFGGNYSTYDVIEVTATANSQMAVYSQTKVVNEGAPRITGVEVNNNHILFRDASGHNVEYEPTIPTKVSELENDSGFITDAYHDSTKQDKINVIAESNTNITYLGQTYVIPQLTADNITTLFNALANGNGATVTDATENTHYTVKQVDTDGDNLFIIIDYFGKFSVEYELDENDQVTITAIGNMVEPQHLYEHQISFRDINELGSNTYNFIVITTNENPLNTIEKILNANLSSTYSCFGPKTQNEKTAYYINIVKYTNTILLYFTDDTSYTFNSSTTIIDSVRQIL